MDTMAGFALGQAAKASGARIKTFDWNKAAQIIRDKKPNTAEAGLSGDWGYTGGKIYEADQAVTDSYTYLSSNWATPELQIDGETIDCWLYEDDSDEWDSGTTWPQSALDILKGN